MPKTVAQIEAEAAQILIENGRLRRENARMKKVLRKLSGMLFDAHHLAVQVDIEGKFDA